MYKEKINELLRLLEEKHLDAYFCISKDEINDYINYLLKNYKLENEYDFYFIGNAIIKMLFKEFDSHTKLVWKNADYNLPIRLKYIDNKVYITLTDDNNLDLLYGEIISINNVKIDKLIEEIELMVPYGTKEFLYSQIEYILYNGFKLKALPHLREAKDFEYEVLINNKTIKRKLNKSNIKLYKDSNYTYEIIDDVIKITYSSCMEEYDGQMQEFVNEIQKISEYNNINKFIVDIRDNTGGNSNIIKPLIGFLRDKNVISLVDKYVFSAGRFCVIDLLSIGSTFVGTGIGTPLNCFGNISIIELDKFRLPISYRYYYYDELKKEMIVIKDKEEFDKIKNIKKYFEPQIFVPDYIVYENIDDCKNGVDAYLNKALELFKTKKL